MIPDLRLIGHSDLEGAGDGVQVMRHGPALYVGHLGVSGMGTSVLDVSDETSPARGATDPGAAWEPLTQGSGADGVLLAN